MPFTIGGEWVPDTKPDPQDKAQTSGRPVKVRKEKRGKAIVTRVLNLVYSKKEVSALATELKSYCGCGGTVKEQVIEVQGDQVERVRDYLRNKGIKAQ